MYTALHILRAPLIGLFGYGLPLVLLLEETLLEAVRPVDPVPPIPGSNAEPIRRRFRTSVDRIL
jgi:hypothetical protein